MSDTLTCVYVTDRGFLPCTCFSILTLVQNASVPLHIYILHTDISPADLKAAQAYLEEHNAPVEFVAVPEAEYADLPRPQSLPKATYGRLLMHKFLPETLSQVLYIDGDTLVDIDVAPLATQQLDGAIIGAVLDVGRVLIGRRGEAQQRLDLGPDGDYFNAGVLIIDWNAWRDVAVGEKCLEALASTPLRFTQKDQCALNYVCRGRWKKLDLKWNFQPACVIYDDREAAIFHFLGGRKPWRADHIRHPMRFVERYQAMYAASPWPDDFEPPRLPYPVKDGLRLAKRTLTPRYWRNLAIYKKLQAQQPPND